MDWKQIPSLSALRAFEATARYSSYTRAAQELNVTDAALRQHIRALEAFFEIPLVERTGRGISITPTGAELASGLSSGFTKIQRTIEHLRTARQNRPVRIALTPAFAENWLIPRLPEFWNKHPDVEIDLAPSIKSVDLGSGDFDLAIRYGKDDWPKATAQMVASAQYTVVAAPNLAQATVTDITSLKSATWLFEETRTEHRDWATAHGLQFEAPQNRFYSNNTFVLSAARAGLGYSLQSRALVETDLATGALVAIFSEPDAQLGYYLLHQQRLRRDAQYFADWIVR
ncbi:MAG: LysR substrate-binding domain-containing protein [Paracoccaceae bacterium]